MSNLQLLSLQTKSVPVVDGRGSFNMQSTCRAAAATELHQASANEGAPFAPTVVSITLEA